MQHQQIEAEGIVFTKNHQGNLNLPTTFRAADNNDQEYEAAAEGGAFQAASTRLSEAAANMKEKFAGAGEAIKDAAADAFQKEEGFIHTAAQKVSAAAEHIKEKAAETFGDEPKRFVPTEPAEPLVQRKPETDSAAIHAMSLKIADTAAAFREKVSAASEGAITMEENARHTAASKLSDFKEKTIEALSDVKEKIEGQFEGGHTGSGASPKFNKDAQEQEEEEGEGEDESVLQVAAHTLADAAQSIKQNISDTLHKFQLVGGAIKELVAHHDEEQEAAAKDETEFKAQPQTFESKKEELFADKPVELARFSPTFPELEAELQNTQEYLLNRQQQQSQQQYLPTEDAFEDREFEQPEQQQEELVEADEWPTLDTAAVNNGASANKGSRSPSPVPEKRTPTPAPREPSPAPVDLPADSAWNKPLHLKETHEKRDPNENAWDHPLQIKKE